jgi:hypothetical protein
MAVGSPIGYVATKDEKWPSKYKSEFNPSEDQDGNPRPEPKNDMKGIYDDVIQAKKASRQQDLDRINIKLDS